MRFLVAFSFIALGYSQISFGNIKNCVRSVRGPEGKTSAIIKVAPRIYLATYHGVATNEGKYDFDKIELLGMGNIFYAAFSSATGTKPGRKTLLPKDDFVFLVAKKDTELSIAKINFNSRLKKGQSITFADYRGIQSCKVFPFKTPYWAEKKCEKMSIPGNSGDPFINEGKIVGINISKSILLHLGYMHEDYFVEAKKLLQ